jgi:hypothetical protein
MLGAPGEDGVFRYTPSPVDDTPSKTDDDEEVADWFNTETDPAIAEAVAKAEAEARTSTPTLGSSPATPPLGGVNPNPSINVPQTQEWPGGGAHHAQPEQ